MTKYKPHTLLDILLHAYKQISKMFFAIFCLKICFNSSHGLDGGAGGSAEKEGEEKENSTVLEKTIIQIFKAKYTDLCIKIIKISL